MKHTYFATAYGNRKPRRQGGASLLEGIAYMGIAAIVVIGAISLLTGALGGAQTNRAVQELTAIRTGTNKLFMGQAYGSNAALNAQLVAAKVFPSSLTQATNGTVTNAWGGAVTVTGNSGEFTVAYAQVPQDVCISLLTAATGWKSIVIGSTTFNTFPITPSQASTACPAGSTTVTLTSA